MVSSPTPEDVKGLIQEDFYCASRTHSLNDDCEIRFELIPQEVRDLACEQAEWPREWVCSYNVLIA